MQINEKFSLLLLEEQFSCSLFPVISKIYLVFNLFLIGEELFYNFLLVSAIQHESVIVIYIPSRNLFPLPSISLGHHRMPGWAPSVI